MYFPILRGKQFELVALKEFAEASQGCAWINPIIEPVRALPVSVVRAANVLSGNGIHYSIILNPERGDFAIESNRFEVGAYLEQFAALEIKPIPAFYADGKSAAIRQIIQDNDLHEVMLVYEDSFKEEKDGDLCQLDSVSYIVCADVDSRSTMRYLNRTGKHIIRLDDNFLVRKPNTAYRGIDEDRYTEEPFYYAQDHFYGFSDYCVLPKAFAEGGTTPTAIAIHLTYLMRDDAIWVRHFVSDEEFDTQNIRQKYGNAVQKVVDFYQRTPTTDAVSRLIQQRSIYPGLGVLKKYTMLNHMQLISGILSNQE